MPHSSFAAGTVPSIVLIRSVVGLHPISITESFTLKIGAVVSVNQLTVLETVSRLPQESVATNILF